ncbi:MAG: hypothetical protein OIF40_08030 [Mangrovicoccus sp.]|nr:hypothetical protein [Mangrovicoccus sp.]
MALDLMNNLVSKNEDLVAQVAKSAAIARGSGQIGDMVRLRDLRVQSGKLLDEGKAGSQAWRPQRETPPDLFTPGPGELPEVDLRDLSDATLRSAMHHHGALIIRNLFSPQVAEAFRLGIDKVRDAAAAHVAADEAGDAMERSTISKGYFMPLGSASGKTRVKAHSFLGKSGAIETFLSPIVSQQLLDRFEILGLRRLLQNYFGDEPCVSYQKSVLRRAEPLEFPSEWHQDGAFMNQGIQSLNLWVSLTDCGAGTESPGMDLVPQRLEEIIPPGTNGAVFNWSISGKTVAEKFGDVQIARPYFAAGDGVFFDHFNLHATSSDPSFTQPRYAIESWFFSKSRCAVNQVPVYW